MNSDRWQQVETIVDTALTLAEPTRSTYIDDVCFDDPALKSEVTNILEGIEKSEEEHFLESPEAHHDKLLDDLLAEQKTDTDSSLIGEEIGPYKVTELIGHGGMGSVFLAKRADDTYNAKVALKLMRFGMDTPENVARFRRERNILAKLNHPNIARLYDGGLTPQGLPYLVMEYVDGVPLFEYCDRHKLTIDERIKLFESVCKAVQHAHQNAVIHRDLKPSNILVTEDRSVKILDFGIAKLMEPDENTDLFQTQTGSRILTFGYAAPEQVENDAITTATDTYVLGILLYKLLSGILPFDLDGKNLREVESIIRNQTAERPAFKFKSLPESQQNEIASSSKTTPARLAKKLQGDLEAIVLKSLRKEPDHRYRSTDALLDDLWRHEQNLPIIARNDTIRYKTAKFFKRHTSGLSIAATFLILITGFIFVYTSQVTKERNQAKIEAEKASTVSDFLMSLFKAYKPNKAKGETVTAQMLLDEGKKRANALSGQPNVEARMLSIIGEVQMDYGNYKAADSLFRRALYIEDGLDEPNHEQRLAIMNNYANLLQKEGKYDTADSVFADVLTQSKKLNMPYQTAITLNDLGNIAQAQSKYSKAESLHVQALSLRKKLYGDHDKSVAASLNNIGLALHNQGKLEEAAQYYRKGLALDKEFYGNFHTETTITMRNLGKLYMDMGQMQHADSLLAHVVKTDRKLLGNNNPRLAEDLNELAVLNAREGDLSTADSQLREILSIQKATLEPDHPRIALALNNLAWVETQRGKIEVAQQYNREALEIARERFGIEHVNTALYMHNLANTLLKQKKYQEAEPLYRQAIATLRKLLPPSHVRISDPLYDLGRLLDRTDRSDKAESLLREALKIRKNALGNDHTRTALAQATLGKCLVHLNKKEEALPLLTESYHTLKKQNNSKSKTVKNLLEELEN